MYIFIHQYSYRTETKEKGFTRSELSEIPGVSIQAVSKWENNVGLPDISQLVPLSKAIGVSADTILGVNNDKELEEIIALREKIGHHPVDFPIAEAVDNQGNL